MSEALDLLYENNRDALVSIALFSEEGDLIASTPLVGLKNSVNPEKESWFTTAMDRIENLHFPRPMCKTSLRTRTTSTAGWYLSAGRWR